MATYKMIQDIEAEDHILGPLSLKQFIFALVAVFLFYIDFLCVIKHVQFLLVIFLPPSLFAAFFAFPFGGDQPTEIWALAKIRFLFKPRRRIWDQSGVKDLVTVTVPKKIERHLTNGLSQTEVQSRLSALANTIDSRGWVIKNVNVNLYANPGGMEAVSDRLIDASSLPRDVPEDDITASDDILDEQSNPIAQQFDSMINASSQAHHQQLIQQMNDITASPPALATPAEPADYWFMDQNKPQATVLASDQTPVQAASSDINEAAFMAKLHADVANARDSNSHMRTLAPIGDAPVARPAAIMPAQTSPVPTDPAILSLAGNNDLNIATLAREAHKSKVGDGPANGEVVISLR